MSELLVNTIKKADGTGSLSVPAESGTVVTTASPSLGRRNRIFNGDMRIDQRNSGSAVTLGSGQLFSADRWGGFEVTDGAMTLEQSTEAPAGFINSLKATTTTADASLGATQYAYINQRIEGSNVSDLAWGTADAKTVTLSFWVRSSLTGTFGGSVLNGSQNRAYPFTYTISSADTWEQKSVTIPGDTTGTWPTTNGFGLGVNFGLGVGSTYSGTAGAWSGSSFIFTATGAVSVIGTLNATWYITGVQLEVGSVATPFEHRSYGEELALCQRYYQQIGRTSIDSGVIAGMVRNTHFTSGFSFITSMRSAPTGVAYGSNSTSGILQIVFGSTVDATHTANSSDVKVEFLSTEGGRFRVLSTSGTNGEGAYVDVGTNSQQLGMTFDAEL